MALVAARDFCALSKGSFFTLAFKKFAFGL
jgi:hypothetical protein